MRFSAWPSVTNPWRDLVEEAQHIDKAGYNTLYIGDHFMHNREDNLGPFMESWSCLAGLAALTANVRLGTLVTGNTYRNPGVLAKQVAQVDVISNGRVTLGMGAGWQQNEHVAYGIPYPDVPERLRRLNESVQIIRSLFEHERTSFDGKYYHFDNAPLAPKPVQPHLPILVGGGGEKVTLRIVAKYADAWNFPGSPEMFAGKVAVLKEHCERVDRDPKTITKVGTMMVGFGEPIGGGRPDPQGWHIVENVSGLDRRHRALRRSRRRRDHLPLQPRPPARRAQRDAVRLHARRRANSSRSLAMTIEKASIRGDDQDRSRQHTHPLRRRRPRARRSAHRRRRPAAADRARHQPHRRRRQLRRRGAARRRLDGEHRDRFFLATKTGERTYKAARDQIKQSLKRLKVDHVDLIQLHNLTDPNEWEVAMGPGGALEAAVEAKEQGLARFIGVTGHGVIAPSIHKRSLERFDFDSVLLPYNYPMMQNPTYAADFEALLAVCAERGVAVQTIKGITLGPWGERERNAATWYEPLRDQADIDTAVHWVLGRPGVFLNTVGDVTILPKVLDAASRYASRPSDADMQTLVERRSMTPFFVLADRSVRENARRTG